VFVIEIYIMEAKEFKDGEEKNIQTPRDVRAEAKALLNDIAMNQARQAQADEKEAKVRSKNIII
jgi:hypothetical protein